MAFSPTGHVSRWGRRRPWLVIGTPLLVLGFIAFYSPRCFSEREFSGGLLHALLHVYRHAGFGHQCQLRCPVPGAFPG